MKSIEELLRNLARPDVLEFGLVTNRLPSINVGGRFEPVDDEAPSTDRVKQMLVSMGGARFIETLSDKPVQWTTRLDGIGVIAIAAIMRKDIVQARFTVARREGAPRASGAAGGAGAGGAGAGGVPVPAPTPSPSPQASAPKPVGAAATAGAIRPAAGQSPPVFARTQQGTGTPRDSSPREQAAPAQKPPQVSPIQPNLTKTLSSPPPSMTPAITPPLAKGASSGKQPVAPPAPPAPQAPQAPQAPPTEEWDEDDDDNEPTVQTLSPQTPQNVPQPALPDEPRPKPARRPEEVRSTPPAAGAAVTKSNTNAPPSPTQTHEMPAPPARGPAAQATSAAPAPAAPVHAAPLAPPAATIDDVDVEITTNDGGALGAADDDEDSEGNDHTVELAPKPPEDAEPESRPQPIPVAAKAEPKPAEPMVATKTDPALEQRVDAIPSTSPSGVSTLSTPEKDRPRIDGGAALESFLAMAIAAHATDLLLVGGRPVLLRVASDLVARTQAVTTEHVERIVKEVLPPRLREALDGEGACDFAIDHVDHGRFRVNLSKHRGGTTIAVRVLAREVPSVRALALPDAVSGATRHAQGLVLVTSPPGHGKSTTVAALVDAINANADAPRHVYTIEDPIEHVHPKRRGMVTQREIGTHVKSWSQAVDDALASDVDVLVVGDVRDESAARAVIAGCEAGKLVIASLSSTTAARAIDRLVESFPANEHARTRNIVATALRLVIGQRLLPSADRSRLHLAIETLPGTSAVYSLVRDGRTQQIPALQQRARGASGFTRLDDSLADLVRAQKVTLDVARQFAESPADLAAAPKKG